MKNGRPKSGNAPQTPPRSRRITPLAQLLDERHIQSDGIFERLPEN